jgi:cytochrome bd-type quinol oxidase subunit 1
MIATLFLGTATNYYLFFVTIEIATTLFILVFALKWLRQKEQTA